VPAVSEGVALPGFFTRLRLGAVDSTSDEVRRRAEAGAGEGLLVQAESQRAGRGRRGRAWASPPGNLYCTLLLKPPRPAAEAAQLSFAAALAVADAAAAFLPASRAVTCKWPNDVLVDGAKLAGILLESRTGVTGGLDWVMIGTGINVASHPEGIGYPATSLAASGAACAPDEVLEAYARSLLGWYRRWLAEGFAPLRAAWLARADSLGRRVTVRSGEREWGGIFESLDAGGALVLATDDGRRQTLAAGEVFRAA
jgi:BirA family biotin operon repressor/biotin-[acetyl-CoA-carboxylase] ligase